MVRAKARHSSWRGPGRVSPWFVVPALLVFVFVMLIPAVRGTGYAFTDWNGLSQTWNFIGLDNFTRLITDERGRAALIRTIVLAFTVTVLQTALGLAMALAVNPRIRFQRFYRVLFFSPVIIMPIVTSYLWKFILGSDGALNQLLGAVGLESLQQSWLGNPTTAYASIIFILVWQYSGVGMAVFLAGLQAVPAELLEAASLDGASTWTRFWYVTWPFLRPALTVNAMLIMITGLKVFDQVWVVTQGGPGGTTHSLSTFIYYSAFSLGHFGYAISMALALTAVLAVIAGAQYAVLNRKAER